MITQKTSRVSRLIVTGTLALAILASGAGGYLVGLSDASTRGDVAQPASDLAAFRASEHQGSAENPSFVNTGASDTIKFLATEHQGSAENPNATK